MVPDHLLPVVANVVAAYLTRNVDYDTIHLVRGDQFAAYEERITVVGDYESIIERFSATSQNFPGCQAITKDPRNGLLLWKKPYYNGDDEDKMLYLLKKYGRVRTDNTSLRYRLSSQFSSVRDTGHALVLAHAHEQEQKATREKLEREKEGRRKKRIQSGDVCHADVTWLFFQTLNAISTLFPSDVRYKTRMNSRCTRRYMEVSIPTFKVALKLNVAKKVESIYLERLRPFLPALLRHKNEMYRRYGRAVRSLLRKRREK